MKEPKIKRYRLPVSITFPKTHPRAGEPTYFIEKINNCIGDTESCNVIVKADKGDIVIWPKLHTIRANYELWEKRIDEVQAGKAVIELYYWEDKPYRSKHIVFATLNKDSGCGSQRIRARVIDDDNMVNSFSFNDSKTCAHCGVNTISRNDGLRPDDFQAWFKGYDLSQPMAIIHFTEFRY